MEFKSVEKKWKDKWADAKIFEADIEPKKKKFFTSIVIPYVNGRPHIGHTFTYTRTDVYARFKRMQGFNTLLAVGFHATGEPIVGAVERLKKNEKTQIETFKMYGATDKDIKDFVKKGPEFVARYWTKGVIEDFQNVGYSIDWRRQFITAIMPQFNRFIEWQYNTLKKLGYVIQGTHPVIWCPHDQSPTGDHDRLRGEGESPTEFVILKFQLDTGEILPCATLRPETVFGVTNLWINPNATLAKIKIKNETWIVTKRAVQKFKDQLRSVQTIGEIQAKQLMNRDVTNLATKKRVPILLGEFVDSGTATGIVMSVPSHSPYDYVALKELGKKIAPISVISVEGFGEHPAVEVSEKMGIKSTKEIEKLDDATSQVYKKEFHTGILREITGKYSGRKVSEAKEQLILDFTKQNVAEEMWEASNPVICRCTTRCHVKILENQWFLKFSDVKWKEKVRKAIAQMKFYPEEARIQFLKTVDWLDDKACARKSGLGTRLPWDKEWIVETLSDSVIYMAFYTIAKVVNENKIPAEKLTDEVFDFVFLGKGDVKSISKRSKLNEKLIRAMREEFEYFYPLDFRNSAKELVPNHLTYSLFHHTAIWDNQKYWPKSYGINGYVTVTGEKMAKSRGNVIPLKELINKYGSDLVRINITAANENIDDANWRHESLKTFSSRLEFLAKLVKDHKKAGRKTKNILDRYLESAMQNSIKNATDSFEVTKFRSAAQSIAFQSINELRYYIDRNDGVKNCNPELLKQILSDVVKMLAPFTPYACEELWSNLGNKTFVSTEKWPVQNERKIDKNIIEMENIFRKTQDDLNQVLKLAGEKKNAYLYFVTDKELEYFKQSLNYLKRTFNFEKIGLYKSSDKSKHDPQEKASRTKYGKPAIYLE